jgi:hypothetical protein
MLAVTSLTNVVSTQCHLFLLAAGSSSLGCSRICISHRSEPALAGHRWLRVAIRLPLSACESASRACSLCCIHIEDQQSPHIQRTCIPVRRSTFLGPQRPRLAGSPCTARRVRESVCAEAPCTAERAMSSQQCATRPSVLLFRQCMLCGNISHRVAGLPDGRLSKTEACAHRHGHTAHQEYHP